MPKHPPVDFKSNRPYITIPAIIREYTEDGTRFYLCDGNRVFVANTYDLNFTFKKGKVKPRHNRGDKQIGLPKQLKGVLAVLLITLSCQAQYITGAQIDQLADYQVPVIHYSKTNKYATFNLFIKNPCTGKLTWYPFFRLIDSAGNEIPTARTHGPVHAHPGTFTFNYWGKRTVRLRNRDNVLVLLDTHLELLHTGNHAPFYYYWCRKLANGVLEEYHENGQLRTRGEFKDGELIGRLETYDVNGKKYQQ